MSEGDTYITLPRSVLELDGLEWPAKILWAEVWAFSRQGRPCWLSLAELGSRVKRSPRQASQYISQLSAMGMLAVTASTGRRRHLKAMEPDPRGPALPTRPTSTKPTATLEAHRVADTKPAASLSGSPSLTNKKEREIKTDENKHRGKPRTESEAFEYFSELGAADEAAAFWDYWESAGWRRKSGPLKDWRAAARNWLRQPYRGGHRAARQLDAGAALDWAGS